jgi:8-oxo-dGTP pyrophosphatase MutT (NUDIX family)
VVDLPPSLLERARAYARGAVEASVPRDAATVVLLRDGRSGLDAYLLRRVTSMAVAAGMHVFPGGSVDPRDAERAVAWAGPDPAEWAGWLGCDERLGRALVCAAVRETFEESGVLLAGASADQVVADTTGEEWEADRLALIDRSLSFAELLARRSLVLRSDLLRPWAHWITPEFEPRRFDTRFFVAALPAGQRPRDVGGEADRVAWVPVAQAVERYQAGAMPMLPPTAATLRELADYPDLPAVLAARPPIAPITPRPVLDGEDLRLVVDGPGGEIPADTWLRDRS